MVWSTTRTCNLKCVHCYTDSENKKYDDELTTAEGMKLIDELADFKIPSLLFSGGEPLMRPDLFTLIEYAAKKDIRPVISTNGTLIDRDKAGAIKDAGVVYVGISLDGMEEVNDRFRGVKGAFKRAMQGFENCRSAGQRVGLRLTLTRGIIRTCTAFLILSRRRASTGPASITLSIPAGAAACSRTT